MKGLQLISLLLIGSIFALTGLRQFFVSPLQGAVLNLLWFLAQVLPLLFLLPGILRLRARAYFFAAMVSMLYFIHGILLTIMPDSRAMGLWEVGLAMLLVLVGSIGTRQLGGLKAAQ